MFGAESRNRIGDKAISLQEIVQYKVRRRGALPRLFFWVYDLAFGVIIIGGLFFFVAAFGEGGNFIDRLADVYQNIIDITTDGTTWTQIMRDNQLYLIIPGTLVMVLLGWMLPRDYTGRATLLFAVLAIGFVAGHVFW